MKTRNYVLVLLTMLFALSCDKDEFFDEFEVDISITGDTSKFEGDLYLISFDDQDGGLLFSSEDITSYNGLGNYRIIDINDAGLYRFFTGTNIDSIRVRHNFYVKSSVIDNEDNWSDYTISVNLVVRRNGSEIDNVTLVYFGDSFDTEFDESYSI